MNSFNALSHFDLGIIAFFLFFFIVLPKFFTPKKPSNNQEYLLMGRGLSLPFFVATLTSTWYGGILGVTQIAFTHGVYSFVTQGLFWYVAYFLFAIILAKKIRAHQVLSLPELIGQHYGPKARSFSAVLLFVHALPITYAISIGVVLELTLGIDFFWALSLGVALVSFYTAVGGFRGVVVTDFVQCILMCIAVIMVVVACYFSIGDIAVLKATLPAHYFTWVGDHHPASALIWLFIACTTTFIHPVFYQRCLAAKSDRIAITGIFSAMGLWLLFDICTCLGGMYARVLLPNADPATAYIELAMNVLPNGLRGLFMAGIIATILSTLDSFLLVAGTSVSYDLLERYNKKYAHHVAILACGAVVTFIGCIFRHDFEATWLLLEGLFSTSILAPTLVALLLKRKFQASNFIVPSVGSLVSFLGATILHKHGLIIVEAFYIAHITGFSLFAAILHTHIKRNAKVANFADS